MQNNIKKTLKEILQKFLASLQLNLYYERLSLSFYRLTLYFQDFCRKRLPWIILLFIIVRSLLILLSSFDLSLQDFINVINYYFNLQHLLIINGEHLPPGQIDPKFQYILKMDNNNEDNYSNSEDNYSSSEDNDSRSEYDSDQEISLRYTHISRIQAIIQKELPRDLFDYILGNHFTEKELDYVKLINSILLKMFDDATELLKQYDNLFLEKGQIENNFNLDDNSIDNLNEVNLKINHKIREITTLTHKLTIINENKEDLTSSELRKLIFNLHANNPTSLNRTLVVMWALNILTVAMISAWFSGDFNTLDTLINH